MGGWRGQQNPDTLHRELERESQRREHVLNMRHALAQEVTQKSKEVAGRSKGQKEISGCNCLDMDNTG